MSVMVKNCLRFTEQQMPAWSLLLHLDKQLTTTLQSGTAAGPCKLPMLCSISSPPFQGFFKSIHTLCRSRAGTKPATWSMSLNSHFSCFVSQQPHHCFSKCPGTVHPYPQHQKDTTQLSDRILKLFFWEAMNYPYLLLHPSFLFHPSVIVPVEALSTALISPRKVLQSPTLRESS